MIRQQDCQNLFDRLCQYDDKTTEMQYMKYYEEFGEFFREYLIYSAELAHKKTMAHRKTSVHHIIEEAVDCMIVLSRFRGGVIPSWQFISEQPAPDITIEDLAATISNPSPADIAAKLSILLSEEQYYELIFSKLNKWHTCLINNGLLEKDVEI